METIRAWPFLISRNRTLDYKIIMAPDFLVESDHSFLLQYVTEQETTKPVFRKVTMPKLNNLSIVYRVIRANINGNVLKDEFGRPILWIEGFVFQENIGPYEITERAFDQARDRIQQAFQEFWNIKFDSDFATIFSGAIRITGNPRENYHKLKRERKNADQNYKIGLVCFIISILLIPLVVGIILLPVSGVIAYIHYRKRENIDAQIRQIEGKL